MCPNTCYPCLRPKQTSTRCGEAAPNKRVGTTRSTLDWHGQVSMQSMRQAPQSSVIFTDTLPLVAFE
jgi:hypothetical protein